MREEVRNSWEQAQEDLKTAEVLLESKRYYACVFFSQQAAEKAIKALYIQMKRQLPMTHNIVELSQNLKAPSEVVEAAQELNPDYMTTRYPNAANGIPARMYSEKSAKMHLGCANIVMEWVKRLLK